MTRPSSRIRTEIARLQEQLKTAETREAERLGRIALRAGLGDFAIDDSDLESAFKEIATRFHGHEAAASLQSGQRNRASRTTSTQTPDAAGHSSNRDQEA